VPGVIGNAESLVEESHEDGLLEYPLYTKPQVWRGREVPEVLRSGNHAAIAAWRHEQRLARTAARRPDLLHAAHVTVAGGPDVEIAIASPADVPELFTLTRACWVQEAQANDTLDIPALVESIDVVRASLDTHRTWVARAGHRLVGSVRTRQRADDLFISRLMVAPDLQGRGLGPRLLRLAEETASPATRTYSLVTGARSVDNLRMYRKAGYRPAPGQPTIPGTIELLKRRRA
jgi:tRNA (guanine37-N1)-methyltransferase